MLLPAFLAAVAIAAISLTGVLFFSQSRKLSGIEKYVVPTAVGVFLSLVLFELLPETFEAAGQLGGVVVGIGFIGFYILSSFLHQRHHGEDADCERKNAGTLLLIGDTIHNLADGFVLGGAFLIDPALGIATAVGLALHEVPQEIVEFGVLLRAGYSKTEAALLNLVSAFSVVVGTVLIIVVSEHIGDYTWVLIALAAGNLLYLATSELLPGIHSNLPHYKGIWPATIAILIGFVGTTLALEYTHSFILDEETTLEILKSQ